MPAPVNTFKQSLKNQETSFGCWVGMADAYAAEVVATAGFDWLLVDGEHAPNDLRSIMQQVQVISTSASHPIVRIPVGETYMIKQVLDAGAQSLLIPMVESAEQARELVKATRYPPEGIRGVGAALTRSSQFNAISDYLTTANDQICLIVQIESQAGIDALDDILEVDGVDGVFIGPSDLAADMGMLGNTKSEELQAVINQSIQRIRHSGKAAGVLAMTNETVDHALKSGACFLGVGIDVLLFANAVRRLAANPTKPG